MRIARGVIFALVIAGFLIATGCSSVSSACDCADGSVTVQVPVALASPTDVMTLSESACAGVSPTCSQMSAGSCITYTFAPAATGACHIDLALMNHTFSTDITIKQSTGCCTELYADPPGNIEASSFR